jgi:hypothetical protein
MDSNRIITAFGAESTAMQLIAGISLAGQRANARHLWDLSQSMLA